MNKYIRLVALGLLVCLGILLIVFFTARDTKAYVQELLSKADIQINGNRPWDIKVHDERLYNRVLNSGSLGLGESYMEGWWDVDQLDQFFYKILHADLANAVSLNWQLLLQLAKARLVNLQSQERAYEVGKKHYDLDNEFFAAMLDKRMVYSCGYWRRANNLDDAQTHKLDLICKKLDLKPGMCVLDIGCGWGGLAAYAAQNYGAKVKGITISEEQAHLARDCCKNLPISIVLQDYRDLHEKFDRIVSVGMFEHVGYKNYRTFMEKAAESLKDDGLMLLHTIGGNNSTTTGDPWIDTYIFPNGMLPSMKQISEAAEGLFIVEDWHNFGADYDKTLMSWYEKFNDAWPRLGANYDDRFYRMWKYYLLSCAGLFRARKAQLWQLVLSKNGVPNGYESIR